MNMLLGTKVEEGEILAEMREGTTPYPGGQQGPTTDSQVHVLVFAVLSLLHPLPLTCDFTS